jgi:hypothetical protein
MPSLFRFLAVVGAVVAVTMGGLYVLSEYFEPESREISRPVHDVKIRN